MSTIPQPPKREGGTPITKRLTPRDIRERKGGTPVVCITAHSAPMAGFLDPHVDLLLVGVSLGMMVYGLDTTVGVSLDINEQMAAETRRFVAEHPELEGGQRNIDRMPEETREAVKAHNRQWRWTMQEPWTAILFDELAEILDQGRHRQAAD